jgi:glycosyltransferase involved in cell wall biosynthesis
MATMNVLYIAPYASRQFAARYEGGAGGLAATRKIALVVRALIALGHSVRLLSSVMLSRSHPGWRRPAEEVLRFPEGECLVSYPGAWRLRPLGGLLSCILAAGASSAAVKHWRPDAVWIYNAYCYETLCALTVRNKTRTPLILQVEDLPLARRRGWFNLKPALDQRCFRKMIRVANALTAVNEDVAQCLPAPGVTSLFPGVIEESLELESQRRRPAFSGSGRTLGYLGALTKGKGVRRLLDFVPRMPEGWRMVMSGAGPLSGQAARMAERYPSKLRFLGHVPDPEFLRHLCECDALVIPPEEVSNPGVFPFKVLEYMISGGHVIAGPLPRFSALDLRFIERWEGSEDGLIARLHSARADFDDEVTLRAASRKQILAQYGWRAVRGMISEVLGRAGCNGGSP